MTVDPDVYVEISASAAPLAGIMKGVRLGVLNDKEYRDIIRRGVTGILDCAREDGAMEQVSYGTPIDRDEEFYQQIVCCPMTYGQALMVFLLQELLEPYWVGLPK